jgi:molybdate transport system substrate-binding protein
MKPEPATTHTFKRLLIAAAMWCLLSAQTAPAQEDPVAITVLAEQQLAAPMTEITRLYSRIRRVTILTAFEDSATQFQKLLEGESGDVIITSFPAISTELKQRGMIDVYSQTNIATDKLLLATLRKDNITNRRQLIDALRNQPVVLLNSQGYIEGLYGQQTLRYLFYGEPSPYAPVVLNSRSALYQAIDRGEGIGIILSSQKAQLNEDMLAVPVADGSYPAIVYHGMGIAGENMPIARDFLTFLRSDEAQAIFSRYGFDPL